MASDVGKSLKSQAKKHQKKADALVSRAAAAEDASHPGMQLPRGQTNVGSEFPARYQYRDDYDDIASLKWELADVKRPAPLTEKDVKAIMKKRAQIEVFNLDSFFQGAYSDKLTAKDPANLRWAQEVNPGYWERREQIIDEQAQLQKRLAKIKLRGPRNMDDIELLKLVKERRIKVPQKALWKLGEEADSADKHFKRGLWNPIRARIYGEEAGAPGWNVLDHAEDSYFVNSGGTHGAFATSYDLNRGAPWLYNVPQI